MNQKLWLCPNCETFNLQSLLKCEVCGEDIPIELRPPIIKSFVTSSKTIEENEKIKIVWITENAQYVFLNGTRVPAVGNKEMPASEEFVLKASNSNGKTEKRIGIKILHSLEIFDFTISQDVIQYGHQCEVSWKARNLKRVFFRGKEYKPNGIIKIRPKKSQHFIIKFEGTDGSCVQKEFDIRVEYPKPIILINKPEYGIVDKSVLVSWSTENVLRVTIDGRVYAPNSSIEWIYSKDACKKTITFYGLDGEPICKDVKIREPLGPSIDSCTLSGYKFKSGDECTLKWSGNYVKEWYFNEEETPHQHQEKTYSFKVTNENLNVRFIGEDGNEAIRDFTIEVIYEPIVEECKIATTHPQKNEPCIIEWSSKHVKEVSIGKKIFPPIGSYTFYPQRNTELVVEFKGEYGIVIKELNVLLPPIKIIYYRANSDRVIRGNLCTISWDSQYVDYVKVKGEKFKSKDFYSFSPTAPVTVTAYFFGSDGRIMERKIHIDVIIPEIHINKLSCTQYKVKRGERVTITWNSQNVKHVAISGQTGIYPASGTKDLVIDQNKRLCITFYGDNGKEQTRYINIKIRKSNGCLILLLILILMVLLAILIDKLYPEIYKYEIVRQIVTIVTRFLNQHDIHF